MSPLPPFLNSYAHYHISPIYQSMFEINIISDNITENEKIIIRECFLSIKKQEMIFRGNYEIIEILRKINKFDFFIKVFEKNGTVKMILYYVESNFTNFNYDILDFNYNSDNLYEIKLTFKSNSMKMFKEKNYQRYMKLKNII